VQIFSCWFSISYQYERPFVGKIMQARRPSRDQKKLIIDVQKRVHRILNDRLELPSGGTEWNMSEHDSLAFARWGGGREDV
jgi:hypothetical protein